MRNLVDPYKVLGLSLKASKKDIKEAFYQLAKFYHPDVTNCPKKIQKFKEINECYQLLMKEQKEGANRSKEYYSSTRPYAEDTNDDDFSNFYTREWKSYRQAPFRSRNYNYASTEPWNYYGIWSDAGVDMPWNPNIFHEIWKSNIFMYSDEDLEDAYSFSKYKRKRTKKGKHANPNKSSETPKSNPFEAKQSSGKKNTQSPKVDKWYNAELFDEEEELVGCKYSNDSLKSKEYAASARCQEASLVSVNLNTAADLPKKVCVTDEIDEKEESGSINISNYEHFNVYSSNNFFFSPIKMNIFNAKLRNNVREQTFSPPERKDEIKARKKHTHNSNFSKNGSVEKKSRAFVNSCNSNDRKHASTSASSQNDTHTKAYPIFTLASRILHPNAFKAHPVMNPHSKGLGNRIESVFFMNEGIIYNWLDAHGECGRYYGVYKDGRFQYSVSFVKGKSWRRL